MDGRFLLVRILVRNMDQPISGQTSDEKKIEFFISSKEPHSNLGGTLGVRLNIWLHLLVGKAEKFPAMLSPLVGVFAKKNEECDKW